MRPVAFFYRHIVFSPYLEAFATKADLGISLPVQKDTWSWLNGSIEQPVSCSSDADFIVVAWSRGGKALLNSNPVSKPLDNKALNSLARAGSKRLLERYCSSLRAHWWLDEYDHARREV